MNTVRFPFYARLALVLLSLVLIIFLLYVGQRVLIPLFFGVLLSFLLYPLACRLEGRARMGRSLSSLVAILLFVVGFAAFVYFLVFRILAFSQDIPLMQQRISEWLVDMQDWITRRYQLDSAQQVDYMNQLATNALAYMANLMSGIFIQTTEIVFWTIIVFIYTYFMLHHRKLILRFILALLPAAYRDKTRNVVLETRVITYYYMLGLFIEFAVMTVANCLAFYLLGIKYGLLLGLLAALLNFIPYLGIIISCILTFLVTMVYGSPTLAMEAVAILFVLHVLDANILLPRVVGRKVKMNPLVTIIAVLVGGALWGVAGMFLAIPVSAMLKIVFENVEGLQPWALIMGIEDDEPVAKK